MWQAGYFVGVAGNQTERAGRFLRELNLPCDVLATSDEWGVGKPNVGFFEKLVMVSGHARHEIAYARDRLDNVLLAVIGAAMKLSLCLDPGRPWSDVLALARRADSAGWHAVYVCDHFMPHDPAGDPVDGPTLECWTVLTALAALTAQVRLGTLVLGNAYRHPAVVANMAATFDQVSPGRLVLGLGAGWQANEYAAYGIALPVLRDRVAILDEACAVIRSLLDTQRSTMNGQYYRLTNAPCDPKPASRVGLLVGGSGLGVMKVAARHADVWHDWACPTQFARKNAALDGLCQDIGRPPGDLARACGATVTLRYGQDGEPAAGEGDVHGTPPETLFSSSHSATLRR